MTPQNYKQIFSSRKIYRWIRPEYAAFLRSGKTAKTAEQLRYKPLDKNIDDGPSAGNYWG